MSSEMSIEEKIKRFQENLELFENDLDKYQYIIDLGKKLHPLEDEDIIDSNLVQGCTSKVWLIHEVKDDQLIFKADSNAAIVKGLVYMITTIFSHENRHSITAFNMDILNELHLSEIITPNRQSGVQGMLRKIVEYAKG